VVVSFICGGNRSIRRKPPIYLPQITNTLNQIMICSSPRAGVDPTTSVVIGCKSNYNTIKFWRSYKKKNITPYILVTIDTITGIGNTTGVTSGAGTAYPSGTLKFVPFVYMLFMMSLHVFTNLVRCCDICCDFRMKTMFGSSLLPFVL
jgi:hypothetical protein